jgi:putative addiction module component (TIGR02574 family)
MKLQEVRESALALPRRSREKLLKDLTDSLAEETSHARPPGVLSDDDPNLNAILEARIAAYERGETKAIPWEEVKRRLYRSLNGNRVSARGGERARGGKK